MLLAPRQSDIKSPVLGILLAALLPSRRADEESALLTRIADTDRAALKTLYDRLSAQSMGVALRVLGSRAEAEDAVQESFIDVWNRCAQFDPARGSARAWVLSIVRNRSIDRLRSRGANTRMVDRAEGEAIVDKPHVRSPLERVEAREERTQIQQAMAELSAEQRHALELAYYEGLSQSEIAARLGEPLGTVKSRVRAAMEKLAGLLGRYRSAS